MQSILIWGRLSYLQFDLELPHWSQHTEQDYYFESITAAEKLRSTNSHGAILHGYSVT